MLDEKTALKAERMLQYLGFAFDEYFPQEITSYQHILLLLLDEYDKTQHVRAASDIAPHEFLKALLEEDNILQKSLVPDCFHSQSQVSEYLHQKKGRSQLSVKQALALGKKFKVNPINFLKGE
jgi:antitoxin component HigA of HigAB toxin-antitoxin module